MKLFGTKKDAARISGQRAADNGGENNSGLSGVQKGLILLAASLLVLAITVFIIFNHFVKPMDRPSFDPNLGSSEMEDDPFQRPTHTQTQTQFDEESGKEIEIEVEVPAAHKEDFYNILIVGTDDDGTRTDTILIARIDTNAHSVALLSVPRDTLVGLSGNDKINSVYAKNGKNEKGMEGLKKSLAKLLGFEVDGYALIDLDAFVELVDLVGGVDFNVPQRMYYVDPTQDLYIDLQPGEQHLDGQKAMQLVRFRGYAAADIQRTKVQQEFLKALAEKCMSVTTLTKVGGLADIFSRNVLTDLTVGNIAYFGRELLKCDFEQMYTHTLDGEGLYYEGTNVWALYLNKTLSVVNEHFNPYDTEIKESNVSFRSPEYLKSLIAAEAEDEEEQKQIPEESDFPEFTDEPDDDGGEIDPLLPMDPFAEFEF